MLCLEYDQSVSSQELTPEELGNYQAVSFCLTEASH